MVRGNRKVLPCPSGSIRGDPWALRMVASDDFASGSHLYHEQRKFAQALVYYRKVIRAARRAIMHGDLRYFVVYWMRAGDQVVSAFGNSRYGATIRRTSGSQRPRRAATKRPRCLTCHARVRR